jgi:hypothetical protein
MSRPCCSTALGSWQLSEPRPPDDGARHALRRAIRRELEEMQPPLRTLAENVLADGSRIDLVARDALGDLVVVMIGGVGEDLELFTRILAHRVWVEQRIPDWLQLAPELELSSNVSALLLCPEFQRETLAAAGSCLPPVQLSIYRDLQATHGVLLLEPVVLPAAEQVTVAPRVAPTPQRARASVEPAPRGQPPGPELEPHPSEFRSGLSEADLQITPEERREFG